MLLSRLWWDLEIWKYCCVCGWGIISGEETKFSGIFKKSPSQPEGQGHDRDSWTSQGCVFAQIPIPSNSVQCVRTRKHKPHPSRHKVKLENRRIAPVLFLLIETKAEVCMQLAFGPFRSLLFSFFGFLPDHLWVAIFAANFVLLGQA